MQPNAQAFVYKRPRQFRHKYCRKRFTVTTGTCIHATKHPLQDWVFAIHSVLTARKGVTAMQLSKELGVQYRTAWYMLYPIREACDRGKFKLANVIEADETYVGRKEKNKHPRTKLNADRGRVGKTVVAGVRERGGKFEAQTVERTDAATLVTLTEGMVEPGSTVYTDDAAAHGALPSVLNQFEHETVAHGEGEYMRGSVHTNDIESMWSVLKRSITGTWQHVSQKHFGWHFNEDNRDVDTIDRMVAFAWGIHGKRLSYADLIADNGESATPVAI